MSRETVTVWLHDGSRLNLCLRDDWTAIYTRRPFSGHGTVVVCDGDGRLVERLTRVTRWGFNL